MEQSIKAMQEQHMQELRAYEVTVASRDARIAELEKQLAAYELPVADDAGRTWIVAPPESTQLAAVQQGVPADALIENVMQRIRLLPQTGSIGEMQIKAILIKMQGNATHPTQQGLEQDAARYQWLREQHDKGDDSVAIFIGDEQHGPGHLDAQIDEAIAAQAKQGVV